MQTVLTFLFTSRRQISIISPFSNRKINIGTNMGKQSVQIVLVVSYSNLFFIMSKNIKQS